jgi:hypothetical protein
MPSNKMRIELPEEIAEKIEEQSQNEGTSRQHIIQHILEQHYSPTVVDNVDQEAEYLKRENKLLYEHVELLKGVSMLIASKQLLPAGEKRSRFARLKQWFRR